MRNGSSTHHLFFARTRVCGFIFACVCVFVFVFCGTKGREKIIIKHIKAITQDAFACCEMTMQDFTFPFCCCARISESRYHAYIIVYSFSGSRAVTVDDSAGNLACRGRGGYPSKSGPTFSSHQPPPVRPSGRRVLPLRCFIAGIP